MGFDWTNYTVEETLQTTGNVYTLFRFAAGKEAAYMYMVNPAENVMAFYTRANVSSPPAHVTDIDLTDMVALDAQKPLKSRSLRREVLSIPGWMRMPQTVRMNGCW